MRKYYTRPCNFHYGDYANRLIKTKNALPLAGNKKIAFDKIEVFYRVKKKLQKVIHIQLAKLKNYTNTYVYKLALILKKLRKKEKILTI